MFDICKEFMQEFFDWLPELSLFCIILSLIGNMVFRKR